MVLVQTQQLSFLDQPKLYFPSSIVYSLGDILVEEVKGHKIEGFPYNVFQFDALPDKDLIKLHQPLGVVSDIDIDTSNLPLDAIVYLVSNSGEAKDKVIDIAEQVFPKRLTTYRKSISLPSDLTNKFIPHFSTWQGELEQSDLDPEDLIYFMEEKSNVYHIAAKSIPFCHTGADISRKIPVPDTNERTKQERCSTCLQGLRYVIKEEFDISTIAKTYNISWLAIAGFPVNRDSYNHTRKKVIALEVGRGFSAKNSRRNGLHFFPAYDLLNRTSI